MFEVFDEGNFESERLFLEGWLPAAARVLGRILGVRLNETVHVVLSHTAIHERRFPRREKELRVLVGETDDLEDALARVRTSSYAHGVSTRVHPHLLLPSLLAEGTAAILLDVDTLHSLAQELRIDPIALIARTAVHETSHVLRGHIQDESFTHGYVAEGDAQRDTWAVLTDLLCSEEWEPTARRARDAQVLLAPIQPRAYQMFGHQEVDREGHDTSAAAEARSWVVWSARSLLVASRERLTQQAMIVPVCPDDQPYVGDHVYLTDGAAILGPWTVIARRAIALANSRREASEIARQARDDRRREAEWLIMVQSEPQHGAIQVPPELLVDIKLMPIAVDSDLLRSLLKMDAHAVTERLAQLAMEADARMIDGLRRDGVTAELPVLDPWVDLSD